MKQIITKMEAQIAQLEEENRRLKEKVRRLKTELREVKVPHDRLRLGGRPKKDNVGPKTLAQRRWRAKKRKSKNK